MARTVLATKPNCWATRRRGALSQACPTASSKRPAKRRLTGQQRYFLRFDSALRTAHPIQLDYHRREVFRPRQIAYLALVNLGNFCHPPATPRTLQLGVP